LSLASLHTTYAFLDIERERKRETLIKAANSCVNPMHDICM